MTTTDLSKWETEAITKSGLVVLVRPLVAEDEPALRQFADGMSEESHYQRFFTLRRLTDEDYARLMDLDYDRRFALIAIREDEIIGVGRYMGSEGSATAEVAFAVHDELHHQGIGTLLLEHLRAVAKSRGITHFEADVLGSNHPMMGVFDGAGYPIAHNLEAGVWEVDLDVTEEATAEIEAREQVGEAASVARILRPEGVAVVGASKKDGSIGNALLKNILESGFQGVVHPVNPTAKSVLGVKAYPSVLDIPDDIDLAIISVPHTIAPKVLEECGQKGIAGAVIITAGFAEIGEEGAKAQAEMMASARHHGVRIIGPNCMGIVNSEPDVRLNATFAPVRPHQGRVGFVSQSGALGIAILSAANSQGVGISSFLSVGNKADISGNDIIQYWETDPETDIGLLYLESFGNPRKFGRIARRFTRKKPLIVVKSGRTEAGARGASSHTAAMASSDVLTQTLFEQAGIIRVDTLEELFNVARVLTHQPLPKGNRVAIVGNSGGPGILAADACEGAGLSVPELSDQTKAKLREVLPLGAAVGNPVDLVADSGPEEYEAALRIILDDDDIDSVIIIYTDPLVSDPTEVGQAVRRAVSEGPVKPVLATFLSVDTNPVLDVEAPDGTKRDIPIFPFPEAPAVALGRMTSLGTWRQKDQGQTPILDGVDVHEARRIAAEVLEDAPEGRWLTQTEFYDLLQAVGVQMVRTAEVPTADEAAALAEEWDAMVALKVQSSTILHKTDVGGVLLGIEPGDVGDAVRDMQERIGEGMEGVVVQEMAEAGVEVIIGVVNDPSFGPLVMFGMGGTATELFKDTAYRIVPITDVDAAEMVRSPKSSDLLTGYRGSDPTDVDALEDLLLRVSLLADLVPEVAEMDMNPVIARADGISIVDARCKLAPPSVAPDMPVRRLRR